MGEREVVTSGGYRRWLVRSSWIGGDGMLTVELGAVGLGSVEATTSLKLYLFVWLLGACDLAIYVDRGGRYTHTGDLFHVHCPLSSSTFRQAARPDVGVASPAQPDALASSEDRYT